MGEIEYAASRTPGCRSVVAEVISGTLVIFCVSAASSLSENCVRDTCRKWLPAFMVPAAVVLLDALPYLSSGKTDRVALEELYAQVKRSSPSTVGSVTPRINVIIDVISDVLKTPIDSHTQLAAAGLDSLSSIRITSLLERAGFSQLDATALFELRNAQGIAYELGRLDRTGVDRDTGGYANVCSSLLTAARKQLEFSNCLNEIEDVFAPTAVQSAMLSETALDGRAYCDWVEMTVAGDYTLDNVRTCLRELVQQHLLLKSGFLAIDHSPFTHAVIVWRDLKPCQILNMDSFNYDFEISGEADLLRPCKLQLIRSKTCVRLLLQIHHALYDQWSLDVLRADLATLLSGGTFNARPSFKTVSEFHSAHVQEAPSVNHLEFWRDHLRDFIPTTLPSLSAKRLPRNLERTSWRDLELDLPSTRCKLRTLGCSVPAAFQVAMAYLLGCYTGHSEVTYGVVFSGRHLPVTDIENVFGPCLATLPLRIDCSAARTTSDLLHSIQERTRAMQKNALTSLADVKRASQTMPGTKLFDTLFVWQETSLYRRNGDQIVREVDSQDHHEFNLVLEFEPSQESIRVRASFQQALVPAEQVDFLFRQLDVLVKHIVTEPDAPVQDLGNCLSQDLLSLSNAAPSRCAVGRGLMLSFHEHVRERPTAPALVFANSTDGSEAHPEILTYTELNARANRLANFLQTLNAAPDELICICMEKCVDLYVAILATIKVGSGYLPLVPETPFSRVRSILDQAKIKVCLCDCVSAHLFAGIPDVVAVDVTGLDLGHVGGKTPSTQFCGSHVAYTVFTSGSTGEPKGVAVTMDNLLGNLQALAELYQVKSGDRLLQACSQAFDVSVFEIFFAFYTGITLYSATKDVIFGDLEANIQALNITHLSLTPTVAALVNPTNVPGVRFLVTAGEGVTDTVHRRWAGKSLHQGYGPSETTNICTVNMDVSPNDALGNIGKPLRNTSAFVISPMADFKLLPVGAVGEFVFGGEQVFRGYIGMDQLNDEKIIQHPKFGRLYRSGDVGRILHDGSLLICGRLDDQIKVRGNRVEVGEINSVLLLDTNVHDAATIVVGHKASTQILTAFVVLEDREYKATSEMRLYKTNEDDIRSLFERLEASLPSYMMPGLILPVTKLPLTSQGKLDRRWMEQFVVNMDSETKRMFAHESEASDLAEDWSVNERQIAAALAATLRISPSDIARNSSFFALGLNSLSAIAFTKLVAADLRINVTVSIVLRNPSTARLARALSVASTSDSQNDEIKMSRLLPANVIDEVRMANVDIEKDIDRILPCTPLQEAMLSTGVSRTASSYCNSTTLRVAADLPTLKRCWTNMIARHPVLRTRFISTSSAAHPYVQMVLKHLALPWIERHSSRCEHLDSQESRGADEEAQSVDGSHPFRIDVSTSSEATRLTLRMHHAMYDGISMSLLLQQVELDYQGKTLPPAVPFDPFLAEMQTHDGKEAMAFWSKHLEGFRSSVFPLSHEGGRPGEYSIQRTLPVATEQIESYCKRHAVSQLTIFQSAVIQVLACCQEIEDLCIGNVVSGRTISVEGIERLIAPCFNTIPVRINLSKIRSNLDLARQLSEINIDALGYQLTPLRRIQALSSSPGQHLFDSLVILQPPQPRLEQSIWTVEQESGAMDMPLVFEIVPDDDSYRLLLHYLQPVVSETLAQHICQAFISCLDSLVRYPLSNIKHFVGFDQTKIAGGLASSDTVDGDAQDDPIPDDEEWTAEEDTVRHVFALLAGVEKGRIRKDTSMYQIGLDSLNAAQVAAQLRSLDIHVDATDVMEAQTPLALAAEARKKTSLIMSNSGRCDLDAFDRQNRGTVLQRLRIRDQALETVWPCTPVQSGMLAQSLHSDGTLYINHVAYRVPRSNSFDDLRRAWEAVTAKHRVLRMGFHPFEDSQTPFMMSILCSGSTTVPLVEANRELPLNAIEEDAGAAIMRALSTQAWRVTIQYHDDGLVMILSLHHALYDADSLQLILEDLAKALAMGDVGPQTSIDAVLSSTLTAALDGGESTRKFWSELLRDAK